jgi:ATP-dependent DNA helicase 2 subunit 1
MLFYFSSVLNSSLVLPLSAQMRQAQSSHNTFRHTCAFLCLTLSPLPPLSLTLPHSPSLSLTLPHSPSHFPHNVQSSEFKTKDTVIILVDCDESMFVKSASASSSAAAAASAADDDRAGDSMCPFSKVMNVSAQLIKDKIILSKDDYIGMVFFGAGVTQNANGFQGINVVREPDEPDSKFVRTVEQLQDVERFKQEIGSDSSKCEFDQALWVCSTLFERKKSTRRIFLFTNRNDPTEGDAEQRRKTLQKVRDLEERDISIELFPLNGSQFDPTTFFMDIISIPFDEDIGRIRSNFGDKLEELLRTVRMREVKKRALGAVKWELAPNVKLAVKLYCPIKSATQAYPVFLDAKTNAQLTCNTAYIDKASAEELEPHQIRNYLVYGGEKVFVSKDEMSSVKSFGDPGLVLMGFKSRSLLKPHHQLKCPYFIYPDERSMKGSTCLFQSLLQKMLEMDKVAIARLIYYKASYPRFVALIPQDELVDADGVQRESPGMHCVFLPFADDIRSLEFEPKPIAPTEVVLKAKSMVSKLKIRIEPSSFQNPRLQHFYNVLQALALDEEVDAEQLKHDESLTPDIDGFNSFKPLIDAFDAKVCEVAGVGTAFGSDSEEAASSSARGRKRKAASPASSSRAGKAVKRTSDSSASLSDADIVVAATGGRLSKFTVKVLKEYCRQHNLALAGKKADLIERIQDSLGVN